MHTLTTHLRQHDKTRRLRGVTAKVYRRLTPSQGIELQQLMAELKTADLAPARQQMLLDQMQRLLDKSD